MSTDEVFSRKDIFANYHYYTSNLSWLTWAPSTSKNIWKKFLCYEVQSLLSLKILFICDFLHGHVSSAKGIYLDLLG